MRNSTWNRFSFSKFVVTATFIVALTVSPLALAHEHEQAGSGTGKEKLSADAAKEVTGEIVDMMCYIDHNAMGEKHGASCGNTCIESGGPVGIVSSGKAYLVVGEHKPMNEQLAEYCGKTVTLKGKVAERGGIAMLENAEIVKK
jgi:hypothetical protein